MVSFCALFFVGLLFTFSQAAVYQSGVTFSSTHNVSFTQSNAGNFEYHTTTSSLESIAGMTFFTFVHVDATASSSNNGGSVAAEASGVVGAAMSMKNIAPLFYAAYVHSTGNYQQSGVNAAAFNVSASVSFVIKSYGLLEEVDSNNNVVTSYDFATLNWTASALNTVDDSRGLKYYSLTATSGSATFAITTVVSSVVGILEQGNVVMTPTTIETFFEVSGYDFANKGSHLRLHLYLGHLSGTASVVGNTTVMAGSGPSTVYIRVDETCTVNGESHAVTVSGLSTDVPVSSVPNTMLHAFLTAQTNLTAEARIVVIDFPVSASTFTYDPAIGFGDASSGTVTTGGSPGTTDKSFAPALAPGFWGLIAFLFAVLLAL